MSNGDTARPRGRGDGRITKTLTTTSAANCPERNRYIDNLLVTRYGYVRPEVGPVLISAKRVYERKATA